MNKGIFKLIGFALYFATLLVAGGCGGGGDSGSTTAKASIKGSVTFPSTNASLNSLVAKQAGKSAGLIVPATDVTVTAYDLVGNEVGKAVEPTFDDALGIYSYTFFGLDLGKDYVIKAKRGNVVLKKLIEKKDVKENTVEQSINSVSTAAVIVASQQLGIVLGDIPPAATTATVATLSTSLSTEIKFSQLLLDIAKVVEDGKDAVKTADQAKLANFYNLIVTAASEGVDPSIMFTETHPALVVKVPIITIDMNSNEPIIAQTVFDTKTVTSTIIIAPAISVSSTTSTTITPPTTTQTQTTQTTTQTSTTTTQPTTIPATTPPVTTQPTTPAVTPPSAYTLHGAFTNASGTGISGVKVTLSGATSVSVTTDSTGLYNFTGLANGSYTLTPELAGYTFSPASSIITINNSNATGSNFDVILSSGSITGTIIWDGNSGSPVNPATTGSITGTIIWDNSGTTGSTTPAASNAGNISFGW